MLADRWLLIIGTPIIIALLVQTARRISRLLIHIDEVRDEMARSPLPPYAQLSEIIQDRHQERSRGKGTH